MVGFVIWPDSMSMLSAFLFYLFMTSKVNREKCQVQLHWNHPVYVVPVSGRDITSTINISEYRKVQCLRFC